MSEKQGERDSAREVDGERERDRAWLNVLYHFSPFSFGPSESGYVFINSHHFDWSSHPSFHPPSHLGLEPRLEK